MTGPRNEEFYSSPPIALIVEIVPMLHWRRCSDCDREQLHLHNEDLECRICGSEDTKEMIQATHLLRGTS